MAPNIRFKKCANDTIVELIPHGRNNEGRSCVHDRNFAQFRCESALVTRIYNMFTGQQLMETSTTYWDGTTTTYKVGSSVYPDCYDDDENKLDTHGIHYYLSYHGAFFHDIHKNKQYTGYASFFNGDGKVLDTWYFTHGKGFMWNPTYDQYGTLSFWQ